MNQYRVRMANLEIKRKSVREIKVESTKGIHRIQAEEVIVMAAVVKTEKI